MIPRILDLDGSVADRPEVGPRAERLDFRAWGPRLRLACATAAFDRFEDDLARRLDSTRDGGPALTFAGSGDFHHVSLALVRRVPRRCNVLVLDNHPDWMVGVPFLHCGTWLLKAAMLPHVRRVFHVGGDVDFDNRYRHLAPWELLRAGKIRVAPAARTFAGADWGAVPHRPLRREADTPATAEQIAALAAAHADELAGLPLYVSLDRDVFTAGHAVVNWDSGLLTPAEGLAVIDAFRALSSGDAGMDVVGDWSPVEVAGLGRQVLHLSEHPPMTVDPGHAARVNGALDAEILARFSR